MAGREKPATPVRKTIFMTHPVFCLCVRVYTQSYKILLDQLLFQVIANVTKPHATMGVHAMMKGTSLNASARLAGKVPHVT